MPAKAFSAPGPYCIANTPGGLPFTTRVQPSAMCTPTRSCRQMTGRMPRAAADSMIGVVGKQNIVEMPSRLRISVIASMTFIVGSLSRIEGQARLVRLRLLRAPPHHALQGFFQIGQVTHMFLFYRMARRLSVLGSVPRGSFGDRLPHRGHVRQP